MQSNIHYVTTYAKKGKQVKLLTVKQVSKILKISRQRVVQLINRGDLQAERIGGIYLILESELKRFKPNPTGRPKKQAGG